MSGLIRYVSIAVFLAFSLGCFVAKSSAQDQNLPKYAQVLKIAGSSREQSRPIRSGAGKTSKLKVSKFYDGQDGYFLSIPTGNESRCIWVWEGGNHAVPYIEVTSAQTATAKHALRFPQGALFFNFKVHCLDDFGNVYEGSFPK
jgi:hypothetical protein